jgi:hypothetical protein
MIGNIYCSFEGEKLEEVTILIQGTDKENEIIVDIKHSYKTTKKLFYSEGEKQLKNCKLIS